MHLFTTQASNLGHEEKRELHTVLYTSGIPCAPDTTSHASLGLLALGTTLPAANMAAG